VLIGALGLRGDRHLLAAQRLHVIGIGGAALVALLHRSTGLQLEGTQLDTSKNLGETGVI
jgi:hypothetical protein